MKKVKPLSQLVLIDWVDSIHSSGWEFLSDFDAVEEQMEHQTVGWVVHSSKTCLAVVQSKGLNRHDPTYDSVMQIPKVAIRRVTTLKSR